MSIKDRVHKKRIQPKPKKQILAKKKPRKKAPKSDAASLVPVKLLIRKEEDSLFCELQTEDGKRLTAFRVSPDDVKHGTPWMHHSPYVHFHEFMKEYL